MANSTEVELFLSQLRIKAKQFGIVYRDREKNLQGLADLEIRPHQREECILNLTNDNYCAGPKRDSLDPNGPDYFVFGKTMTNGKSAYVKLTLGKPNKPVQCWSFHLAEFPQAYPLKKLEEKKKVK